MSLAIIAGSGLGGLAGVMAVEDETPFADIPGVGAVTIVGHAGRVITGRIDGRPCRLVLGRRHFYEGDAGPIDALVRYLAERGATTLLVTSAVGALRRDLRTGDLVVIRDMIDHQDRGSGSAHAGVRRIAVDPVATRRFEEAATAARVAWQPGTMFCASGPVYETLADVAYQQYAGADVAAMSGAPEVTVANRLGLPVVSVTVVTNPCTGIAGAVPSHDEVLAASARAAGDLVRVVRQFIVTL